uniref:Uncharacterized protein n=1 Tax=Acrobeloides nanus TaxID=290746 RepID=A0A914BYF7_9BILA
MADDEAYIFNLYLSKIPPKETICSILLPTCHEEYVSDETPSSDTTATPSPNTTATPSSNTTVTSPKPTTTPSPKLNLTISSNTSACLACNLCMTGSTILMQKFILVQSNVDWLNKKLNDTLFDLICAELCHNTSALAGKPGWFPYCGCRDFIQRQWNFFFNGAKRIFMPNYLCANTLGWCRLNETPNIVHCLKDLCSDWSREMQILKIICNMIPDEPEEADKYLNIKRQKEEL